MINIEEKLGVTKTGPHTYVSNSYLPKPAPASRGVYGGALAAQALLVAIKSCHSEGMSPHSLHSYFVKPTSPDKLIHWEVTEISNGKNFTNRNLKALQDGVITYIVNVSLTKKNSFKEATNKYEAALAKASVGQDLGDNAEEDEETEEVIQKPFRFQTDYPEWLKKHPAEELGIDFKSSNRAIYHSIPPEMTDLQLTKDETSRSITDRRLAFYAKWGLNNIHYTDDAYKFAGLAFLSDSYFLTRLGRLLRIENIRHDRVVHYFSVSLDHIIYFHDDDFDPTEWIGFAFKAIRFSNNRALLEGELYNDKGIHVASIVQEGLVYFNGLEREAKI